MNHWGVPERHRTIHPDKSHRASRAWIDSQKQLFPWVTNWDVFVAGLDYPDVPAAESYTPTMKDMLSIQGAIERYERGMDTRDRKLQESAFWDDAIMISPQGKRPFKQSLGGGPPLRRRKLCMPI